MSCKGSFTSLRSEPLQSPCQRLSGTAQAWSLVDLWLKWCLQNGLESRFLPGFPTLVSRAAPP